MITPGTTAIGASATRAITTTAATNTTKTAPASNAALFCAISTVFPAVLSLNR